VTNFSCGVDLVLDRRATEDPFVDSSDRPIGVLCERAWK